MKVERLIYILLALLNKRQILARNCWAFCNLYSYSISRYVPLSLAGRPIYSERGDKGGFYIPDDYKMDSFFTEKAVYHQYEQMLAKLSSRQVLSTALSINTSQKLLISLNLFYFDLTSWSLNTNYLLEMEQAIQTRKESFAFHLFF